MKKFILPLFFLTFLALPLAAQAQTTYYVDNTDVGASDANDGSMGSPWLTLGKALSTISSGDTVICVDGDYAERLSLTGSHANSVWDGSGTSGAMTNLTALEMTTPTPPSPACEMDGFTLNGSATGVTITGFIISYGTSDGCVTWSGDADGLTVDNNFFDTCADGTVGAIGDGSTYISNLTVTNNYIYRSHKGVILYCTTSCLVAGNEIERPDANGDSGDIDYTRMFGDGITFRSNFLHGALNADIGGAHLDGIQWFDVNGDELTNLLVEQNIFAAFREGLIMRASTTTGSADTVTIRNNVFWGTPEGGGGSTAGGSWGLLIGQVVDAFVYNNAFISLLPGGTSQSVGCDDDNGSEPSNCYVQNNVFYDTCKHYWPASANSPPGNSVITEGGYNLWNDSTCYPHYSETEDIQGEDPLLNDPDGDFTSLVGADGLPFTSDDGYVPSTGSSPLLGAGFATSTPTLDIFGNTRDGAPDIGPVDYSALSGSDMTAPTISSTTPADNATGVSITLSPAVTFDETIVVGTGDISLYKTSGDVLIETITVPDAQVTFSGAVMTINPASDLEYGVEYYIVMDSGVAEDSSGNAFGGIASTTDWSWTTLLEEAAGSVNRRVAVR